MRAWIAVQPFSAGATLRFAPATPEAENAQANPFLAFSGDGAVFPAPAAAAAPANYWNAAQLDPDGRGAVDLTLPETPGLWRLDAWVFTPAGAVRQSQILRVEAPLQAQWSHHRPSRGGRHQRGIGCGDQQPNHQR